MITFPQFIYLWLMKHFLVLVFILLFNSTNSQQLETEFTNSFSLDAETFIGIDEFENIYYIKNNVFFKSSNQETVNYSNLSLGKITSVDIHNPFKIVLFYRDYNCAIILDNKLNELTNKIDFTKNTLFNNVLLVSHSSENNLWLFADDNKLHQYDFNNNSEKFQTQPITFYQEHFVSKSLKSTYKYAWLLGNTGVIQINEYGNFISFYGNKEIDIIFPYLKGFIAIINDSFHNIQANVSTQLSIQFDHIIKDIHINNSSINIFDGSKVYQYTIL